MVRLQPRTYQVMGQEKLELQILEFQKGTIGVGENYQVCCNIKSKGRKADLISWLHPSTFKVMGQETSELQKLRFQIGVVKYCQVSCKIKGKISGLM